MTTQPFASVLRIAALSAALSVGALLPATAQAGLVSGSWDPEFGPALPGMSWAVHAELLVPNGCTGLSGAQDTATGPCVGATVLGMFLRLYDTAVAAPDWSDPAVYFSTPYSAATFPLCNSVVAGDAAFVNRCSGSFGSSFFDLTALRIEGGSVAGLQTPVNAGFLTLVDLGNGVQSLPTSALGNEFSLSFTLNGPQLTCTTCAGGPVVSDAVGLRQFLITYTSDDTSAPKYSDGSGNALGVRLDEKGNVIGRSTSINGPLLVPEPGSLGLAAAALAAAALLRRRRR